MLTSVSTYPHHFAHAGLTPGLAAPSLATSLTRRSLLATLAVLAVTAKGIVPVQALAPSGDLVAARRKLNIYGELYLATHKFQASWDRYTRLVNPESGPTGKEARLIGVTAPDAAIAEMAAAEALLRAAPSIPEADRAAKALIHFYREAAPLMTAASAFYPTYKPQEDQGREGQVWHRKMKSVMTFTVDARRDLFKAHDVLRGEIEPMELVQLERKGRDARWHVKKASVEARKVRDVFPVSAGALDPDQLAEKLKAFATHVETCRAFDQSNPGKLLMFAQIPNLFQMSIARLASQIAARPDPRSVTAGDIAIAHSAYAQLVQFSDLFFANAS